MISPLDLLVTPLPQTFKREGLRGKQSAYHRSAVVIIPVREEIHIPFAFSLIYVICIAKGGRSPCFVQDKCTLNTVWSEGFSFVLRDSTSHMCTLSADFFFFYSKPNRFFFFNHPELSFFWER